MKKLSEILSERENQILVLNILNQLDKMNSNSSYHRYEWEYLMKDVKIILDRIYEKPND